MSLGKKITAFLTSLAVVVSATGCGTGKSTSWSARFGEYETSAGIFIYYEMNAYYEALNQVKLDNPDIDTTDKKALKASVIDNKDMLTWIQDEATENLRKFLAVQSEFDTRGLSLTETEQAELDASTESAWEYYGEYYESNGIGEESFKKINELAYKSSMLFESYYGEDGTDAVAMEELEKYYQENYARVELLSMGTKNSDGFTYDDDTKKEIKELAEEYVERINDGEEFSDIRKDYEEFSAELAERVEAKEEEENGQLSIVTEEVTVTEANAENTETVEEVTEEETTTATEEVSEEETTAATEEISEEETTAATEEVSEEETTTATEEVSEEEVNPYANEQIIKKGSEEASYAPSKIVNNAIFEQVELEKAFFVEDTDNGTYYVIVKYDILERKDLFEGESYISTLTEMKGEDYDNELLEIVNFENIVINDKAYNRYNPFDFEM